MNSFSFSLLHLTFRSSKIDGEWYCRAIEYLWRWKSPTIAFIRYRYSNFSLSDQQKLTFLSCKNPGGNIEAVEICLNNGGSIDDQQDDLSTPVHLAASQGSMELTKLMFTCQPQLVPKVIRMTDVQGMTSLHKWVLHYRFLIEPPFSVERLWAII